VLGFFSTLQLLKQLLYLLNLLAISILGFNPEQNVWSIKLTTQASSTAEALNV
jgi:hypothetical protein